MLTIDSEQCIGCLQCISVCPFQVLGVEDGKPAVIHASRCIKCLHCAAACPENAIRLGSVDGILSDKLPETPGSAYEQIREQLMRRRSYRRFKPEPVPEEILNDALRIAAWAPSAKNQHPAKWIVVRNEETIKLIMDHILDFVKKTGLSPEIVKLYERGQNVVMGTAKTLLLAYSKTDAINPFTDTALAMYHVDLVLQSQGIGTCWAGYLMRMCNQVPEIKELINLPEGCQLYAAMMAGYPDQEHYIHIPNRHIQPDVRWI